MQVTAKVIASELARLQRNRGLQSAVLTPRVGPMVASLTGFDGNRGAEGRDSLARTLVRLAHGLAPDLRLAFLHACAVRASDPPTLQERLELVAQRIDRSVKVARRRLDVANLRVAERLLDEVLDDRGWFLARLVTEADFTAEHPVHLAQRTLVVTAPILRRVTEMISLPGQESEPDFTVTGSASLSDVRRAGSEAWEFSLTLDAVYECGDTVTYDTAVRLPSRMVGEPFSVMAPRRPCFSFETTVHLGDLADRAWILDGVTPPSALSEDPGGRRVDLTASTSPSAAFRDLTPGLVYGVKWRWGSPGAGSHLAGVYAHD